MVGAGVPISTSRRGKLRALGERPFRQRSAELLGQCDDDALGAADVTEPILVLVLHHLADELGAVAKQAGKDVLEVVDGEHDATDAQRVHRRVFWLGPDRRRRVELVQLEPPVAVRGPHHGDVASDAVEPDDAVDPPSLDGRLALKLQTKFDKERDRSLEVVDNEEDVVHPQNRHVPESRVRCAMSVGWSPPDFRVRGPRRTRAEGAGTWRLYAVTG